MDTKSTILYGTAASGSTFFETRKCREDNQYHPNLPTNLKSFAHVQGCGTDTLFSVSAAPRRWTGGVHARARGTGFHLEPHIKNQIVHGVYGHLFLWVPTVNVKAGR